MINTTTTRKTVRKKPVARHKHKWVAIPTGDGWKCYKRGCWVSATLFCLGCDQRFCAEHAPRPRKAKPVGRWSAKEVFTYNGLLGMALLYDGRGFHGGVEALAALLNKHRVRP